MNAVPVVPVLAARVLIVDDERRNRELLEVMLAPQGFVLLSAVNGDEALAITARERPDIVLLDVTMPGLDGYQVVAKLKADPATTNIPVIMITALDDRNARMMGLNAGAEEFLSKPIDRAELLVRVRNLLRLKAYSDFQLKHGQMLEDEVSSRTAELVASEKRYREIVESTTDGIIKLDADAMIMFANRRFATMLGYETHELLGKSVFTLMSSKEEALGREAFKTYAQGTAETYDRCLRRRDGEEVVISVAGAAMRDEHGQFIGVLASGRDVTDERKMLAQLTVSDRMASIGTLAAGVAHEINNPLACVLVNLDLATKDIGEQAERLGLVAEFSDVKEGLRDAREASERIRHIVRDLKVFSGPDQEKTGPVDIQRVMESTLRMAWNEIRHRARLVKNYGRTLPAEASDARLGQVFLNLIVNAAQAITEGSAEKNEIRITTAMSPDGNIVVEVGDTGPGMPPEVLDRLFTPFFTTKPADIGTGLGLSICQRIVTGFGGSIDVTSEVGKGTTFRISLPAAHSVMPPPVPSLVPSLTPRRRGRILVVDDEPMISKTVSRALSGEHDVTTVDSAEQALERIGKGECFDVILCDMMMPQMTGMDMSDELVRLAPEQASRIVFLTGGAFTPRARTFLEQAPNLCIDKPFNVRHLRSLINNLVR